MRTLDRYIFRQTLVPVLGALAALTAIALLSQSLTQFDLVVERGQSGWTFLRITLLSLPQLAGTIFPIALFVGSLVALTRLQGEHEFTAAYASGMSLARIAYPIVRIGVYFALISLAANLFLQPWSARAMRQELYNVKNDLVSTLVKEGDFSTSETGLTIYVKRIDQNGLLRQIFIRTPGPDGHDRTYAAREGRIIKQNGLSYLVMRKGSSQQVNDQGILEHATFDEYSIDITPYFASDDFLQYKESDRYMHELFFPNMKLPGIGGDWERGNWRKLFAEGNARLASPLYNLSFLLLAFVAVLGGRFSRNGYARRIAIASAIAGGTRIFGIIVASGCESIAFLNFLQYLVPLIPIFVCYRLIRKHDISLSHQPSISLLGDGGRGGPVLQPLN
ncbi:LptF/LptG family permease [Asticcacaulis sp. EMRT-3]|uniref:LptF/LptG family permease n=1 Tax=Asticcacaulis sp. EMRT-3 TaxID=3040349 RepID=UPI0024AF5D3E|nr:LptF/LptG family permease [Asticcacaulis sp. EMRT-3]MDI7774573.1 LptF/LptG family permease [Asticcacaulis sp. EMRT-3]